MNLKLFNTLTRKKETFKPIKNKHVGIYACGLTVYNYAHIGNLRTYLFEDLLKRVLLYDRYSITHVMNITDVGHLTSDADTGEDKMELSAKREHKSAYDISKFYTKAFKDDLVKLNILRPDIWCKATDHITEQIELVKILEKKGFTYKTSDGIYFNTAKLADYGELAKLDIKGLKAGKRVSLGEKKNKTDFALWKFSPKNSHRQMEWKSPWGIGFPGWHLECSAMSNKYLGQVFDIHCGGVDHINVHHTNEIAQSKGAYGKIPAKFWLHGEYLLIDQDKMAKSQGNFITLRTLEQRGYNPLAFRYLILSTHWRQKLNFTWDSLEAAQRGLAQVYGFLYNIFLENRELAKNSNKTFIKRLRTERKKFADAVNNDLNSPKALAVMFNCINEIWADLNDSIKVSKNDLAEVEKLFLDFDKIFGLGFKKYLDRGKKEELPRKIKEMVTKREAFRRDKKFSAADKIRKEIEGKGYEVEDTKHGPRIKRKEI